MTPIEAHRYAHRHKIDVVSGPNYVEGRKQRSFDGWGWHNSLNRFFKGPNDYRTFLRANGMEEWGDADCPQYKEVRPPIWTDETLRMCASHGLEIGSVMGEALKKGLIDWPEEA